jgi:hypothetical protein
MTTLLWVAAHFPQIVGAWAGLAAILTGAWAGAATVAKRHRAWECVFCGRYYARPGALAAHLIERHPELTPLGPACGCVTP